MASLYGVNATKLLVNNPPELSGKGESGGRMRVIYDTYTLTADTASADVLYMGALIPKGARVMEVMVKSADLDGSGGTLDVGWAASADGVEAVSASGFLANIDVATAADVFMMSENAAAPAGLHKQFTASCQPIITFDGDCDATSGSISIAIWYVLD